MACLSASLLPHAAKRLRLTPLAASRHLSTAVERPRRALPLQHDDGHVAPLLTAHSDCLTVHSPQHDLYDARFPYIWLRDACTASHSIDPSSRQKLFRTTDIPASIRPRTCRLNDGEEAVEIEWDQGLRGASTPTTQTEKEERTSRFSLDYLARHLDGESLRRWHSDDVALPVMWDRALIEKRNLWIPYDQLHQREVLYGAVEQLLSYGIVFFRGVPAEQRDDETCELPKLASMLGDIRRTWYGDKVWDVKSVANAKNIAYTNLDLGLHMDLLHYENPPRFQLLHYLHSHSSLKGGESYFVDAYRAAEDLKASHPGAWHTLVEMPVAFEYRNGGHWRHAERPTLELAANGRDLHAVNYSPPFQAPLLLASTESTRQLHRALSLYADRIESPDLRYTVQLQPGDCVAFDNRRVLHARTAFSWDESRMMAGETGRHLKGCYVEGDSVRDRLRVLRNPEEA